ncbi:hypothetical protein PG993_004053 [Apiospora rasikravindrae]|uniref:Clr5 domain-containing protein n=1 Tax=Apiospora rasikravindrae TaxID=990691 RepID=A0ABR1TE28_9PEZI
MEVKKRHEKDLRWESFRVDIERKFVRENLSLEDIRSWLQKQGLNVTKHQLNYRLNKVWGLRSKAPRGQAHEFWQSVRQLQASEQPDRGGLSSFVLNNRQRLKPKHLERQLKRNNIEIHSPFYAGSNASVASTQQDTRLQVALRSPTLERAELTIIPWPQDLPWLVSSFQNLKIETSQQAGPPALRAALDISLLKVLGIPEHSMNNEWSRARYISSLASQLPGPENGDGEQRPQVIQSGRMEKDLGQHMKLLLANISNHLLGRYDHSDRFQLLIDLVEGSGLTKSPLDLHHRDLTLHSVSDALFQGLFRFLCNISFHRDKLRYDTHRVHRVLIWLLRSGQDPNTPIGLKGNSRKTSGLQISLAIGMSDLALELLAYGASPDGVKSSTFRPADPIQKCFLHPLYLAISYPGPVLTRLESCGASLLGDIDISPFSTSSYGVPYARAPDSPDLTSLPFILYVFEDPVTTSIVRYLFDSVDLNGKPVYRGLVDWNMVFLFASGAGDLEVLKFLLARYHIFRSSEYPDISDLINRTSENGLTALHAAVVAKRNSTEICRFLLQHGAILDSDSDLLHLACYVGALETVKFFHQRGMSVNQLCRTRSGLWNQCDDRRRGLDPSRQTPLELTLHLEWNMAQDKDDYFAVCGYLINNGSQVPWTMVNVAVNDTNPELLSLALRSATNIVDAYQKASKQSPLSTTLRSILSFKGKDKIRSMSHLLLDAGAQVGAGDAARAAFLGDWNLVTRILDADTQGISRTIVERRRTDYGHGESPDSWITTSLLETAILSGSLDVARQAFELSPQQYDAGALCAAASLAASNLGDYGIVRALLRNRREQQISTEQTLREMTAIGIAAHAEDWELFQLLRYKLPWSDQAIVPYVAELSYAFELQLPTRLGSYARSYPFGRTGFVRFWNDGSVGSIQVFAARAKPRIFDLFFNSAFPLSREGYRTQRVSYDAMVSPIHTAIYQGDASLVRACLDLGSDINGYDTQHLRAGLVNQRLSPLTLSIESQHLDIASLLLDKGADVNSPACLECGMTPLQAACITGQIGMVMKLLRLGANHNAPGAVVEGRTALEGAAEYGRLDIVHLLLRVGVETDGSGRTQYIRATLLARYECHIQVQKLLESHRVWTDEDKALWNDTDLRYDFTPDASETSSDDDSEGEEEEEEAELWSNQQDRSLDVAEGGANLGGTTDIGQSDEALEVYDGPGDQQETFGGSLGGFVSTNDPFIGYGGDDDMLDTGDRPIWDDLFYI